MKTLLLSLGILFFLIGSTIVFVCWKRDFRAPEERNPLKIEANLEISRKLLAVLPASATTSEIPQLRSGHRPTRQLAFCFNLIDVITNDPGEAKRIFLSYLAKIMDVLNTTPQIRPYLEHFPIDSDMLTVSMLMNNKTRTTSPFIGAVSYCKGEVDMIRWIYHQEKNEWTYEKCGLVG